MLVIFSNFPFWQQGTSLLHQDTLAVMCLPSGDMPQSGCVVTFIWKPQSLRGQVHLLQYHNTFTNNCWCDLISAWHKVISYYWFRIQKWVAQGLPNLQWEVAQNSSRNRQVPLEVENEQSKSQHGVSHHTLSKPRIADLLTLQLHLTEVNKQQVWKNCRWLKQLLWPPGAPSSSSLCCYWAQKHGRYWYQWIRWSR